MNIRSLALTLSLFVGITTFAAEVPTTTSQVMNPPVVAKTESAEAKVAPAKPAATKKTTKVRHRAAATASPTVEKNVARSTQPRFVYDEAKNLLIPEQKYLLRFEDEENYGKVSAPPTSSNLTTTFNSDEVEQFRTAVDTISNYRNYLRSRCSGGSARALAQGLDKYLASLAEFNRRGLPLLSDISENTNRMILIINRTTLVDAPVLIARHLQFKKQRFKENMGRFLASDAALVESLVTVAKILKVDVNDEDWNKSYGSREDALDLLSLWPRETIFEATEKLADARETVCVVETKKPVTDRDRAVGNQTSDMRSFRSAE